MLSDRLYRQLGDDAGSQHSDPKRAVAVANLDHSLSDVLVGVLCTERDSFNSKHDVSANDQLFSREDRGQVSATQTQTLRGRALRDTLHQQPGTASGTLNTRARSPVSR